MQNNRTNSTNQPAKPSTPHLAITATLSLLLLLLAPLAPSAIQAAEIGFVNAPRLVAESPQWKTALKKLETEFAAREKKLQRDIRKFKTQQENFEKNRLTMAPEQLEENARQLRELQRKFARSERELNEDFTRRRNEELAKLEKYITEVVAAVAKAKKLDVVLQQVIYGDPKHDLTEPVLAELKKRK